MDRSGRDPDGKLAVNLPHGPDIVSGAFASDVSIDNDPIDVDSGYARYNAFAAITPARDRTLDEVKGPVTQRWRDDEIASRLKTKAADLLDKLKGGNPFATVASGENLKVQTASDLKRGGWSGRHYTEYDAGYLPHREGWFRQQRRRQSDAMGLFQVTDMKPRKLDANSADAKHIEDTLHDRLPTI